MSDPVILRTEVVVDGDDGIRKEVCVVEWPHTPVPLQMAKDFGALHTATCTFPSFPFFTPHLIPHPLPPPFSGMLRAQVSLLPVGMR